ISSLARRPQGPRPPRCAALAAAAASSATVHPTRGRPSPPRSRPPARACSTIGLTWKACVLTNPPKPLTLVMLSADAKLAEIKRLYYQTTKPTIQQDLTKALDLLKSMANEEERERAAVYMHG